MTAVAGAIFSAAQFNQYVRDNLNETAVAKATTTGQFFVATGANALAARIMTAGTIATSQSTTSLTYTDLATIGPTAVVDTGVQALVMISAAMSNNTGAATSLMSYAVSGATTVAAVSTRALRVDGIAGGNIIRATSVSTVPLNAGTNTFTAKFAVGGGTGTFSDRSLQVIPF